MKKVITTICCEEIRGKKNEVIGSREIINEFYEGCKESVCITKGLVKLSDGRIVVNKVLSVNGVKKSKVQEFNLLTGKIMSRRGK